MDSHQAAQAADALYAAGGQAWFQGGDGSFAYSVYYRPESKLGKRRNLLLLISEFLIEDLKQLVNIKIEIRLE